MLLIVYSVIRKDWGALIIVDERFGKGDKYIKG